ncbi:anthranilate synthase component I family protein [Fluviicola sp.]|jgi:para-aminobenzoate synthetase component 1|uniref:chorismate-binding protein n=1 Tax=Fluviicola sp. TaxID=1917219 RepID=UPI0028201350|nr:anthranilate synthase component I family protein [Fluviicola sp.]MDR0801151.1 anthranilate synthase component I family protein [Fluviicola sp.]
MLERAIFRNSEDSFLIGIGCEAAFHQESSRQWNELDAFIEQHKNRTLFTIINYQLGSDILNVSHKPNVLPLLQIWVPKSTYLLQNDRYFFLEGKDSHAHFEAARQLFQTDTQLPENIQWKAKTDHETYLQRVNKLKEHIQFGDIYEINFCQLFEASGIELENMQPFFQTLWKNNPTPFTALAETENWMLASASPERFIRKVGNQLISQPIKGTAPRGKTITEERELIRNLEINPKERAENIMIVDLVRNDLSQIATKGSVRVDELCAVYTFPTVHQLISTISCELKKNIRFSDILKAVFPMGSMTGAPKKAAVELSEYYEGFSREFYSGSFGVIYPNGDFDLNVLIRTIVYNPQLKQLSCGVGGAITILSDAEAEYEECRTKVGKILALFGTCQW